MRHVLAETLSQMQETDVFVSIPPRTFSTSPHPEDVKFCTELGMALMLSMPIIFVVRPGVALPKKLLRVADNILEADISTEEGRESLARRMAAVLARLNR